MSKKPIVRKRYHDEAFKLQAVRILAASGRKVEEVAQDLGIAWSTLSRWKTHFTQIDMLAGPHHDVQNELSRLRRENELLRAERDLLKKATAFFAPKAKSSSSA
jgi:transposase